MEGACRSTPRPRRCAPLVTLTAGMMPHQSIERQPPPQPVPAVGQASHTSRVAREPAAMETANVEKAFTGFPFPHSGHFFGWSFSPRINTSNWCPHAPQLYS